MGSLRKRGAAIAGCALVATVGTVVALPAFASTAGVVRVDQGGYAPGESKTAYLMATGAAEGEKFSVLDAAGHTVLTGAVGATSRGAWNTNYPAVYPIDLTGLRQTGTYHVEVTGPVKAGSLPFTVRAAGSLYGQIVRDGVTFYQTQRDGRNVIPGLLDRQPSHLNDAKATVYAAPHFVSDDDDAITDTELTKIGGPVDVEGGWFDAGDYLKFTHTTAYGAIDLLVAQRALGASAPATLAPEAQHGIDWLNKAWDQKTRTLYIQVGLGVGNGTTITGDHDIWRIPQADDADKAKLDRYSAAHRPVFAAAAPGAPISPNLVGRVAAAFALAAQRDVTAQPGRANAELKAATSLFAQADTTNPPVPLVTAQPNQYYPETSWHDDMELAAAEIALAQQQLNPPAAARYIRAATGFAKDYLGTDAKAADADTFNLYDTSALAHADLIKALDRSAALSGLTVTRAQLVADLKRQVQIGATRAAADIFHAGGVYTAFDADSHTFGLIAAEALYRTASGDHQFDTFATAQRDWLLGANAWGQSFMVGEGVTFPACPQNQEENLQGSTDRTGKILIGAVVNGPNDPSLFTDGIPDPLPAGAKPCPVVDGNDLAAFDTPASQFLDDVRAWQTDEPALDMTGAAIVGAALQSGH